MIWPNSGSTIVLRKASIAWPTLKRLLRSIRPRVSSSRGVQQLEPAVPVAEPDQQLLRQLIAPLVFSVSLVFLGLDQLDLAQETLLASIEMSSTTQ